MQTTGKKTMNQKKIMRTVDFAIGLAAVLASTASVAQTYTVLNIGTPNYGGAYTFGTGINATGDVTGYSTTAQASKRGAITFVYSNGEFTPLTAGGSTYAYAIDSALDVVGRVDLIEHRGYEKYSRGFVYSYTSGSTTELGTLGGNDSEAFAINDVGQITGDSRLRGGGTHAFIYSGGVMTDLGTLGGSRSSGRAINGSTQIAGYSTLTPNSNVAHAILITGEAMSDLGTLGGAQSEGYGINAAGHVTGNSDVAAGTAHAFLYSNGSMSDLGTLGGSNSYGYAVNSSDQVVGKSQTSNGSEYHAFLYSNGQMVDLNTLIASDPNSAGVTLTSAVGINDQGWIVANGTATSGCLIPNIGDPACTFVLVPTGE